MATPKRGGMVLLSAAMVGLSATFAGAADSATPAPQPALTQEQWMDRLNAMQARLDQLEAKQQKQDNQIDKVQADATADATEGRERA